MFIHGGRPQPLGPESVVVFTPEKNACYSPAPPDPIHCTSARCSIVVRRRADQARGLKGTRDARSSG